MALLHEIQSAGEEMPVESQVLAALSRVMDPEIPALNVVEMGIIRKINVHSEGVTVTITPTYSGCPAMEMISSQIRQALRGCGLGEIQVKTTYAPPWTSDWLTPEAHRKLRESGIAAPPPVGAAERPAACPYCGSEETELRAIFGCTACKSMHFCNACRQPFEGFKAI